MALVQSIENTFDNGTTKRPDAHRSVAPVQSIENTFDNGTPNVINVSAVDREYFWQMH